MLCLAPISFPHIHVVSTFVFLVAVFVAAAHAAPVTWAGSFYASSFVAGQTVTLTATVRPNSGAVNLNSGDTVAMRLTDSWATGNTNAACKLSKQTRSYDLSSGFYAAGTSINELVPDEEDRMIGVTLSSSYSASATEYTNLICRVTLPATAGETDLVVSAGSSSPFDDLYIGPLTVTTVETEPDTPVAQYLMYFSTKSLPTKKFKALVTEFFSNMQNTAGIPLSIAAGINFAQYFPDGAPRALSDRAAREAKAATALGITPRGASIAASEDKNTLVISVLVTPSMDFTVAQIISAMNTDDFVIAVNKLAASIKGELADANAYTGTLRATCHDGVKDGDETDVDCGGVECYACTLTETCKVSILIFSQLILLFALMCRESLISARLLAQ